MFEYNEPNLIFSFWWIVLVMKWFATEGALSFIYIWLFTTLPLTRKSDTPLAGFEPAQNLNSSVAERGYSATIAITPRSHQHCVGDHKHSLAFYLKRYWYWEMGTLLTGNGSRCILENFVRFFGKALVLFCFIRH